MRYLSIVLPFALLLVSCKATQPPPPPAPVDATAPPVIRSVEVNRDVALGLNTLLEGWTVSSDIPEFLLEEFAHHLEHELEARGLSRTDEEMREVARQRLDANEVFIFNPSSRSYIMVDFSKLRDSEKAPSRQSVFDSARYAADSLSTEEGVSDMTSEVSSVHVEGADYAFRLDADFQSHGNSRKFSGVVGFADPYWFFVYYTDTLAGPGDYATIDNLLDNLTILHKGS